MFKSFAVQLSIIIITVIAVIFVVVYFVNRTNEQTMFTQTKALQSADFGFQAITEKAISPETGEFVIDSLQNISGTTEDGGEYSVEVSKYIISTDSIEIKIESKGKFKNETRAQLKRMLFVKKDSANWVIDG